MTQRLRPDHRCPVLSLPVKLCGVGKFLTVSVPPHLNEGDNTAPASQVAGKTNNKVHDGDKKRHRCQLLLLLEFGVSAPAPVPGGE